MAARTLRDEFAMAALATVAASFIGGGWSNPNEYQVNQMVKTAYQVADAMMKAREQ
jgi:hypothetical protein